MREVLKKISPFNGYDGEITKWQYIIKKVSAFFIIYFISQILAEIIVISGFYVYGYDPLIGEGPSIVIMRLVKYYGFTIFIAIIILYKKFIEKGTIRELGLVREKSIQGYLKGMLRGIILSGGSIITMKWLGVLEYNGLNNNVNVNLILAFIGAFMVQGAMEEILTRGFLMNSLLKKTSKITAIFISSGVFTILHFNSFPKNELAIGTIGTINLLLVSLLFSIYVLKKGNIWMAAAAHSTWNFVIAVVCGINLSGTEVMPSIFKFLTTGRSNILNGGDYGIEASIFVTGILLIGISYEMLKYSEK